MIFGFWGKWWKKLDKKGVIVENIKGFGVGIGVFGNSGTCCGTCLELSITDNQLLICNYGTKVGNCLGSVGKLTIN